MEAQKYPEVIRIRSRYTNCYLVKNDSDSILIDAGSEISGNTILEGIRGAGLQPEDISLIIITHGHYDHCKGLQRLKQVTNAKVLVQKEDAQCLTDGYCILPKGKNFMIESFVWMGRHFMKSLARYPATDPDIIFEDRYDLKEYGIDAYAMHTPGHTSGSLCVILNNKYAYAGDTLFGVFRRTAYPPFVDHPDLLIQSWQRLIETGCTMFYPAHGGVVGLEKLKKSLEKHFL